MPYMLGALAGPDWQGTANRALLAVMNGVPGIFEGTGMTPRQFITYYSTNANSAAGIAVYRAALATVEQWDRDQRAVLVPDAPVSVPPAMVNPVDTVVPASVRPGYVPPIVPPVTRPPATSNGPVYTPPSPAGQGESVATGVPSSTLLALAGAGALAFFFMRRKGN